MSRDDGYDYLYKVVIVGDSETGKSSLLSRYIKDVFSEEFRPTIGVEFGTRNVGVSGKNVKAQVWDTAGQERYMAITSAYYRGAVGAIIVYDITNRQTFDNVGKWLNEIQGNAQDDVPLVLVGNKLDMASERKVSEKEVSDFAEKNNIGFLETSAKDSTGVEAAFKILLTAIFNKISNQQQVGLEAPEVEAFKICSNKNAFPSPEVEEKGAEMTDNEIPTWAEELFEQIHGIKERLQALSGLENTVEKLCTKVDNLDMRLSRIETKKINFKTAHSKSAQK